MLTEAENDFGAILTALGLSVAALTFAITSVHVGIKRALDEEMPSKKVNRHLYKSVVWTALLWKALPILTLSGFALVAFAPASLPVVDEAFGCMSAAVECTPNVLKAVFLMIQLFAGAIFLYSGYVVCKLAWLVCRAFGPDVE